MAKIGVKKVGGILYPECPAYAETLSEMPDGVYMAELTRARNYEFHKKFFSLVSTLFNLFNPPIPDNELTRKYGEPVKSIEVFRGNLIVQAGHYEAIVDMKGEYRLTAKSISFAKMDEAEFSELYNKVIDIGISSAYIHANKVEDIDNAVNQIMEYS